MQSSGQPVQSPEQHMLEQPILLDTIIVGSKVCFSNNADDIACCLSHDSGTQVSNRMKELICTDDDLGIFRLIGVTRCGEVVPS